MRFHAMQSTITFLAITIIDIIFGAIPFFGWILGSLVTLVGLIFWIPGMAKAYQGEYYKFPIVGEIAENK